jgi:hypothetical protein
MSRSCERCWEQAALRCFGDTSKTQTEHYHDLLAENQAAHSHQGDGLREAIESGLREVYLVGDEYEPGRLPHYAEEKLRAIEPRVRAWHEREVAALKAEVARLREIAGEWNP